MKLLTPIFLAVLLSTAAHAADVAKKAEAKPPACGKTAEECQVQVTALTDQLQTAFKKIQAYSQLLTEAHARLVDEAVGKK